ncbi:MAG: hypothetical protein ABUL62_21635 [Myxococcales bacterium]
MRAVSARLLALFAALVMLLPGTAAARAQYYCRMTGHIIGSVACDDGALSKKADANQELQAPDCCQRLSVANRSASLGTLDAVRDIPPAACIAVLPQAFAVRLSSRTLSVCAETTQAPLAIGPPLFIAHCAFLS